MGLSKVLELIVLSLIMALTSYLAGFVPLKLSLSPKQNNYISFFSMGIILGTSLVIAIPEGIETLYNASESKNFTSIPHYIGLALVFGFILMYLIDHLQAILNSFNINLKLKYEDTEPETIQELIISILNSPLTLGLVCHAMVDGISLGSAFAKDDNSLELVFFMIIIIHKLPTCFSLTSLLLKENLNISVIKVHLLIFAAITPVSSLMTLIFIYLFKWQNDIIIGNLLVFSGGTFLYVVTHVMLEVASPNLALPQSADSEVTLRHRTGLEGTDLIISIAGIIVPIILSFFSE